MVPGNKNLRRCFFIAAVLSTTSIQAQETETSSLGHMFRDGNVKLDFRYRYEYVDQDNIARHAQANSLRSRLTYSSATYAGFSFLTEFDNVTHIFDDDFNSTENAQTRYPVVADPDYTEVNQAWLGYRHEDLSAHYGRQRILHGNQRFIGGVGWRQNEQTYDGLRAQWQGPEGLAVDIAYVYNANRIFGPDDGPVQPADLSGDNWFVRGDWKINEQHSLNVFSYLLDIDEEKDYAAAKSVGNASNTYGLEYAGKFGPVDARAAVATQSDAGDSNLNYDTRYYLLEGKVGFKGLTAHLGYEVLAADNGVGFKTPYATLHAFQGWADMFLVTPGDGIEDIYGGLAGKIGPVSLAGIYHDFQAEDSSADFGSELDLVATWPVSKQWQVQLKYANFSSDDESRYADTQKAWVVVNLTL